MKWRVTVDYGDALVELGDIMGDSPEEVENKVQGTVEAIRSLGGTRYVIHPEGKGPLD